MAYLNESGLAYFWGKLKNKFVAKETGKGLSTNDYSNSEKQKVADTSDYLAAHIANTNNPHKTPNNYHTPSYSTGIKIGVGSGIKDLYVPEATDKIKGATIVYQQAQCTTYTSDFGTCTPAAVKKAIGLFVKQGTTDGTVSVNGQNIAIPGFISYSVATEYTDSAINSLVNGAPTTLDTLKEIADAMAQNQTVVEALDDAIGSKASASDLTGHINNKSNPHAVTAAQVGLGNVENKSSATIRGELTKANVTDALGYTPPTTNTTYSEATTSAAGLMSASDKSKLNGIASGANKITVDNTLSATSTNPVQNKIIKAAIDEKANANIVPTNWINGSSAGSLKMIAAKDDSDTYTLAPNAIAENFETSAAGFASHAEGFRTTAGDEGAHSEGTDTVAAGQSSHAEGISSHANGISSHAEGYDTRANGLYAHTEGLQTYANGSCTHTEGNDTRANADAAHAEGIGTETNGIAAHTEGYFTYANEVASHAEGFSSYANGHASHAEGQSCSFGEYSHAEGQHNSIYIKLTGAANSKQYTISYIEVDMSIASGMRLSLPRKNKFNIPIVMGSLTSVTLSETLSDTELVDEIVYVEMNGAYGKCSHVEGTGTIAFGYDQHVEGQYNIPDSAEIPKYIHIAGNGTKAAPSNAYTLDWTGIGWFARDIYIGGTAYDDGEAKKVSTENYVDSKFNQINSISASRINQICGH